MSHSKHSIVTTHITYYEAFKIYLSELYQLITNVPYMLATAGMTAGNFGLGGLSEWYG